MQNTNHKIVKNFPRVDSQGGNINKYQSQSEPKTEQDLVVAQDAVMQIVKAFVSNFQNNEHDLARLITDRFTLREDVPFPFHNDELEFVVEKYGEKNDEIGGEDFVEPWWDSELRCWCIFCRYSDMGLRQYIDGWEYGLDGKRWKTAAEAYLSRNM